MAQTPNITEAFKWPPEYHSVVVDIGGVPLGGEHPLRIQSMTNTPTMDTEATVQQVLQLVEAGCEYVRITTASMREAVNLKEIRDRLRAGGCDVPLIADVHYLPEVAEYVANFVDKVRINPGNYTDRSSQKVWTDTQYTAELESASEKLKPLIEVCKRQGTAIRIGTNHGSLSARILHRYGNTAEGMAESAMEFVRICHQQGFHKLVLSMKSSNLRVMVFATRLLVARMMMEGFNYPIHLGVTEAGNEKEGRIKSAAGIGALLIDGIGDTLRVSLTEDPVKEIPVAKLLASIFNTRNNQARRKATSTLSDPFAYKRRASNLIHGIGGEQKPIVVGHDQNPDELPAGLIIVESGNTADVVQIREIATEEASTSPIIFKREFKSLDPEDFMVRAAVEAGPLLIDGLIDGLWITAPALPSALSTEVCFDILQACGSRITKTEFIACPSCGRTRFGIEKVLGEVKQKTGHLKGLKIAVMGCVVNGPGEMADADYGYVGGAGGKVNIYKGQNAVFKNIPEDEALDGLIGLIKESGDWQEPATENSDA